MSPYVRVFVSWFVGWLVSRSVGQSVSLSICFHSHAPNRALVYYELPYYEPIYPSVRQLVCWLVGKPVGQLVCWLVGKPVGQLVSLSICFTSNARIRALVYYKLPYYEPICPSVRQLVGWLVGW